MTQDLNITQLRNELQKSRQELASRIGLRDEAHVEQVADVMDQIQAAEAREFALRHLDRYARQLRQIDEALHRIDTGEYGVCAECEEEIGARRLRAVPWAQRCIKCQESFDQRGLGDSGIDLEVRKYAA